MLRLLPLRLYCCCCRFVYCYKIGCCLNFIPDQATTTTIAYQTTSTIKNIELAYIVAFLLGYCLRIATAFLLGYCLRIEKIRHHWPSFLLQRWLRQITCLRWLFLSKISFKAATNRTWC
jgi:hypothetical protein